MPGVVPARGDERMCACGRRPCGRRCGSRATRSRPAKSVRDGDGEHVGDRVRATRMRSIFARCGTIVTGKVAVGRNRRLGALRRRNRQSPAGRMPPSKTEAARLCVALFSRGRGPLSGGGGFSSRDRDAGPAEDTTSTTRLCAHGGQQLAFGTASRRTWLASMHIYHVASGTPVAAS